MDKETKRLKKLEQVLSVFEEKNYADADEVAQITASLIKEIQRTQESIDSTKSNFSTELSKLLNDHKIFLKNSDYSNAYLSKEIDTLKKALSSIKLQHGKDAIVDYPRVVEETLSRITLPQNGKDAPIDEVAKKVLETIEIPTEDAKSIADKLNEQKGIIDVEVIRGYRELTNEVANIRGGMKSGFRGSEVYHDATLTGKGTQSTPLSVVPGAFVDDKVKYDAADPTAGYVADKFVAGTGITLSEGIGADENKLVITNSLPVSPGHIIQDNSVSLPQETKLNFIGATVTDNPGNSSTDVTITGSGLFATLSGSNQPFTGNIELDKIIPELKLTDGESSRLTRYSTSNTFRLRNTVNVPATPTGALSVSSTNTAFTVPFQSQYNTTAGSISMWIKTSDTNRQALAIFKAPGLSSELFFEVQASGYLRIDAYSTSPAIAYGAFADFVLNDGNWHYIVISGDSTSFSVTIDNVLQAIHGGFGTFEGWIADYAGVDYIGIGQDGGRMGIDPFIGEIDEVLMFDHKLTPTEISYYWNSGIGTKAQVTDTGLVGGWHLDEGAGNTLNDFSYYSNTASGIALSWIGGIIPPAATVEETEIIKSVDGVLPGERGITEFGDLNGTSRILGTPEISKLITNGFVVTSGSNGALSVDTTSYQPSGSYELLANKATDFSTINDTLYPTVKATNDAIVSAVVGLLDYRGSYDASSNLFPATGGSGLAGAILKGDFWICSIAGTLGGKAVAPGDLIIALQDTPGQTSTNWDLIEHDLGYAPEDVANKVTSISGSSTDVQYPSAKLLYDQLALKLNVSAGLATNFGDGADGDVTIAAGTTTLTRDMYYNNLTVTGTLKPANFRIFVKGTINGAGTIQSNGGNGGNALGNGGDSGGPPGTAGQSVPDGYFSTGGGQVGGGGASNGATGSTGNAGVTKTAAIGAVGVAGGAGGNSNDGHSGGPAGPAGPFTAPLTTFGKLASQTLSAIDFNLAGTSLKISGASGSGSGGGGGGNGVAGSNRGGGGGGGSAGAGGVIYIIANTWAGTFTMQSNGGNGGNGGNASGAGGGGGGGAGGNGGIAVIVYGTKTWSGSYNLSGGSKGTGGTTVSGNAGADGTVGSTGVSYEINMANLTR